MGRKCTVHLCESSSNRIEDRGVTFHKLPVNENVKLTWLAQCHLPLDVRNRTVYVCSRHFRRADFQAFKGTKYMLKTGAIPSMFAWGRTSDEELDKMYLEAVEPKSNINCAVKLTSGLTNSIKNVDSNSNNKIKRTQCNRTSESDSDKLIMNSDTTDSVISKVKSKRTSALNTSLKRTKNKKLPEPQALPENGSTETNNLHSRTPVDVNEIECSVNGHSPESKYDLAAMNLVPGSRVEAKDFNEQWNTARVVEVDNEENEILIQFEKWSNKSDEWIPMNSSRLRPIQLARSTSCRLYSEGERCMARWTDCRKFPATVRRVLENDSYEVLFDDGYIKTLSGSHLSRITNKVKNHRITSNTNDVPEVKKTPSEKDNIKNTAYSPDKSSTNWYFRWEGNHPVGRPGSIDTPDGAKRPTVIVDDPRLPTGWTKHVVKRHGGSSAGKWDIVIVNQDNRKFRSKKEIDSYFLQNDKPYNPENFDFGLHRKRAREINWATTPIKRKKMPSVDNTVSKVHSAKKHNITPKIDFLSNRVPVNASVPSLETEMNHNELDDGFVYVGSLKVQIIDNLFRCPEATCGKNFRKENLIQMHIKHYHPHLTKFLGSTPNVADLAYARTIRESSEQEPVAKNRYSNTQFYEKVAKIDAIHKRLKTSPGSEGFIISEQIKVESMDEDFATNSEKKFVNTEKEHKSEDNFEFKSPKLENQDTFSTTDSECKINAHHIIDQKPLTKAEISDCPLLEEALKINSPARRNIKHHVTFDPEKTIVHRYKEPPDVQKVPGGGIKRLLPKKREEYPATQHDQLSESKDFSEETSENLDSTFVKPNSMRKSLCKRRIDKTLEPRLIQKLFKRDRRKKFMRRNHVMTDRDLSYEQDENTESNGVEGARIKNNVRVIVKKEDLVGTMDKVPFQDKHSTNSSAKNLLYSEQQYLNTSLVVEPSPVYITEDGEKIKLVRMRREEIINCACGFPEEDGLMMQCELCLCWQHANCLGIARESEVPERYVCAICCAPKAARPSRRYVHDQEWLLEGRLPSLLQWSNENETKLNSQEFSRSIHEATGNALELVPVMKSLRAKLAMAGQTDHPKFYYWAKPWTKHYRNSAEASITSATNSKSLTLVETITSNANNPNLIENLSPTLQSIHRDFCNSESESEILGARIENEMNLMKSKNIMALQKINRENCNNRTFPNAIDTPSRVLNIDSDAKVDDFTALVKSEVFDANVDISAILESNNTIPSDSELVSILEGDLKNESDLNSPVRLNNGTNFDNSETDTDEECKNDPTLNMDLLAFMASDEKVSPSSKSSKSMKSTSSVDLGDPQSLLAPLLASPGGTKFDLVSDCELEKFAESVGRQVFNNTQPVCPIPEEAINNEQCRRNLLLHVDDYQTEVETRLDELNDRLTLLLANTETSSIDLLKLDKNCSKLVKLMQRDLKMLADTCTIPIEQSNVSNLNSKNLLPQQHFIQDRPVTPMDLKQL